MNVATFLRTAFFVEDLCWLSASLSKEQSKTQNESELYIYIYILLKLSFITENYRFCFRPSYFQKVPIFLFITIEVCFNNPCAYFVYVRICMQYTTSSISQEK